VQLQQVGALLVDTDRAAAAVDEAGRVDSGLVAVRQLDLRFGRRPGGVKRPQDQQGLARRERELAHQVAVGVAQLDAAAHHRGGHGAAERAVIELDRAVAVDRPARSARVVVGAVDRLADECFAVAAQDRV
jgi:hypothetical protein